MYRSAFFYDNEWSILMTKFARFIICDQSSFYGSAQVEEDVTVNSRQKEIPQWAHFGLKEYGFKVDFFQF